MIFFRPLLVEREHADEFFEFRVFPPKTGNLQTAGSRIVGLQP